MISSERSAAGGAINAEQMSRPAGMSSSQNMLTTTVWPKSRMLFAIVSKMSKEGALNEQQRGTLKDLILEQDNRIMSSLALYE
jgi:hypothetical protein